MLYGISLIVVFLALAALYESWSIPFSVMLVVPIGVVGALLATDLRGLSNDVYFQVGLLTTMGLSAKNAILIVEFAVEIMQKEGKTPLEAAVEAAQMRLRPILMTSLAFIGLWRAKCRRYGGYRWDAGRDGTGDLFCSSILCTR